MNPFSDSNAFYSAPSPVMEATPEQAPQQESPKVVPIKPPAYTRYADDGTDTFAPSSTPLQAAQPEAQISSPPMFSIPLIAAGLFGLWMILSRDK